MAGHMFLIMLCPGSSRKGLFKKGLSHNRFIVLLNALKSHKKIIQRKSLWLPFPANGTWILIK
jgi:hypothetical protein